jgi:hypothetical protein
MGKTGESISGIVNKAGHPESKVQIAIAPVRDDTRRARIPLFGDPGLSSINTFV